MRRSVSFLASAALLFLHLAAAPPTPASPCGPAAEQALAAGMLGQLTPDQQADRAAAVNATLSACPGAIETFLSALMSWQFLTGYEANPAMAGTPVGLTGYVGSGRAWGALYGHLPFVIQGVHYEGRGVLTTSPLILDLDGDGVPAVAGNSWAPHSGLVPGGPFAPFDVDGDGWTDVTEWVKPGDGLLVAEAQPPQLPVVPDPRSGRELIGTAGGFAGGFDKLAHRWDLDHDGVIAGDERSGLWVWQDVDGDAVADPGEMHTLAEHGIESLALPPAGVCGGSFTRAGGTGAMWDWWPSYVAVNRIPDAVEAPASVPLDPRPLADHSHVGPALYAGPEWMIPSAALAAAGFDLASGRLAGVSPDGRWYVLSDVARDPDEIEAGRARRIWILDTWNTLGWWMSPRIVPAPIVDVLQMEFESATSAIVAADGGSRLLRLDLATGSLRSLYARVAGQPAFRASNYLLYSGGPMHVCGNFCAADGGAGPVQFARVDLAAAAPALVADGSLDAMRVAAATLGTVLQELPVSPRLAYFAVRSPEEHYLLLEHRDGALATLDTCLAPMGLAADSERVVWFHATPGPTVNVHVRFSGTSLTLGLGSGEYAYPYLGALGSRVIVTSFDWPNARMTLLAAPADDSGSFVPILTAGIGAVRLSRDGLSIGCLAPEGLYLRPSWTTDVSPAAPGPSTALRLHPARPNPAAHGTTIRFDLPAAARVRVELFSVDGRRTRVLLDEDRPRGPQAVRWDGRDGAGRELPAGTYVCRVAAGGATAQGKVTLLR
jgi:hypothetical protein